MLFAQQNKMAPQIPSLFLLAIFGLLLLCLTLIMADADATQVSIVYTKDQLLNLRMCGGAGGRPENHRELRRKCQGCRAGRRRRLRKRRYRLSPVYHYGERMISPTTWMS